ncbi:hypothetical protein ACFY6Y_11045 [Streptomyces sp. NPDC012829]
MDEVVKFVYSYLCVEHSGNVAVYSESDEVVNRLREASMEFWYAAPGVPVSPSFGRAAGMSSEQLAKRAARVKIARRALFLVAEYRDPDWGALYAGYVGGDRVLTAQSYGGLLYVTKIADELKIVASYKEDIDEEPPPLRWRHSQGANILLTGPPVAVRPLGLPTGRAAHQQDWQMLSDAAPDR